MNTAVLRRLVIAGGVATGFLSAPDESHAIFHWLARCCQPAVPCAQPVQVAQYVPTYAYRAQCVTVPVTTYRPVTSCGPCGAAQVSYMPVTTYQTQTQMVPYLTYRIVYSQVAAAPVVANYAAPVASPCCGARPAAVVAQAPVVAAAPAQPGCCSSAATTYYRAPVATTTYYGSTASGYSAYAAPAYRAGFGPPGAGLPVDNSTGNLLQSGVTGSSIQGVSPTLSPGGPFASGTQLGAPTVPMPAQPQIIQAPAAGMPQGQPAPAAAPTQPPEVPGAGSQKTYAEEPAPNGNAAPPAQPSDSTPTENKKTSEPPYQPIPREEAADPAADPASGPAIVPPASRSASEPAGGSWAYSRVTYLAGGSSLKQVDRPSMPVDQRPAVSSDGWRASSR